MFEEGARRLLEERKRLKMNQDAMAEAAQVAKSTYCNYEAGKRAPDALALAHLAQAGADVLYILTGQRAAGALAPDEAALLDNYRHTPPERRHTVQEVSSAFAQCDEAVKKARAAGGGG